jgi:formate dehydrogenase assembly factor FdhD
MAATFGRLTLNHQSTILNLAIDLADPIGIWLIAFAHHAERFAVFIGPGPAGLWGLVDTTE